MTAADSVRTIRSREAILDATATLIHEEGAASVTHQRVAERAGVGRATVYRHWPNPADLLADALARTNLDFLEPAPGTLVQRLHADMQHAADELNSPSLTAMAATIIERSHADPAIRAVRDRLVSHLTANLTAATRQAHTAGELAAVPDADDLLAQLLGPLWARRLLQGTPITDTLVERTIDATLAPWLTPDHTA